MRCDFGWAGVLVLLVSTGGWAAAPKVACAGEHSTQSAFVDDNDEYPAILQRAVGAEFVVGNFGYRRSTVQLDGPSLYPASTPYLQTSEFQQSLVFAPDVVVLGPFGRHDCNLEYADPGSIDPVKFAAGLENIVKAYLALPRPPVVLLALPIPYPNGTGVGVMHEVVLPVTHQVALKLGLQEIDHWNTFLNRPELFANPDHFTDAGIQLMAQTVLAALRRPADAGVDAGVSPDAGVGADAGAPDGGVVQPLPKSPGCGCGVMPAWCSLLVLIAPLLRASARAKSRLR